MLPAAVFFTNAAVLGPLVAYSFLNFLPDIPASGDFHLSTSVLGAAGLAVLAPTVASVVFLRPVFAWSGRYMADQASDTGHQVPSAIAMRAADVSFVLAGFSLLGWRVITGLAANLASLRGTLMPAGLMLHLILRPVFAGAVAATAAFFTAEHLCRARLWPALLARTPIAGNTQLRRVRLSHRLLVLWLAISALPLGAVALTTFARVAGVDLAADPMLGRLAYVVLLIAVSAALGGAGLARFFSRTIARPLEALSSWAGRTSTQTRRSASRRTLPTGMPA
jgi:hypothetical protein